MTETERQAWLQLAFTPHIGAESFAVLLQMYGTASAALQAPAEVIAQLGKHAKHAAREWHCKPPPPFASNDTTFYKLPLSPRQNLLHLNQPASIFTCRLLFWLNLCSKSQLSQTSKAYCLHTQSDNSAVH